VQHRRHVGPDNGWQVPLNASSYPQSSKSGRLSFPFFFDPNFNAEVQAIEWDEVVRDDKHERWDQASVHEFSGTYGEYLLSKVAKVFPELERAVL
jgi:isopenicillin N synthase-like dioxygenase